MTQKIVIPKIERNGEAIVLPANLKLDDAIKALMNQQKAEEQEVQLQFDFNENFVWDGAYAFAKVMEKRYGFVFGKTEHSWFGDHPPQLVGIETSLGHTEYVSWGHFTVPAVKGGVFFTQMNVKNNSLTFRFICKCKQKYSEEVHSLEKEVRAYLKNHSVYKGKAISIRFKGDDGEPLLQMGIFAPVTGTAPSPVFLDLSKAREHELIFPADVENAIRTNLFTPIERMDEARRIGVPIKRGILLAGDFGVGKTLTAYIAAQKATSRGITYVYCTHPQEFPDIMRFAAQYSPALVFCEDVDRIVPLDRDEGVDALINIVDGIESKSREIITVFTTNEIKNVHKSLLRPGRMDAVIPVHRPDSYAVQRLIRIYCGQYLEEEADLTSVGKLLADNIPAVIREVCERSKLAALRHTPEGDPLKWITSKDLEEAATTMKMQLDLLNTKDEEPKTDEVRATEAIAASIARVADSLLLKQKEFTYYGE